MKLMQNTYGASNLSIILGITLSCAIGWIAYKFSNQINQIGMGLWPFAALVGLFIVVTIHLRFKLNDLTGTRQYSVDEQRRIDSIVNIRTKRLSYLLCYYIVTAFVLILTPYLNGFPKISNIAVTTAAVMLFSSTYCCCFVAISFIEIDKFRAMVNKRAVEDAERKRLLDKLNGNTPPIKSPIA